MLGKEGLGAAVEVDSIRGPCPSVPFVRVQYVPAREHKLFAIATVRRNGTHSLARNALVSHGERDLVGLRLLDARVVRALADEQWRLSRTRGGCEVASESAVQQIARSRSAGRRGGARGVVGI